MIIARNPRRVISVRQLTSEAEVLRAIDLLGRDESTAADPGSPLSWPWIHMVENGRIVMLNHAN
jgi:hypothetical protein